MKKLMVVAGAVVAMSLFVGCSSCKTCNAPKVKAAKCTTCKPAKVKCNDCAPVAAPCATCDK